MKMTTCITSLGLLFASIAFMYSYIMSAKPLSPSDISFNNGASSSYVASNSPINEQAPH